MRGRTIVPRPRPCSSTRRNVELGAHQSRYANVTAPIAGRAGQQQVTEGALVGQGEATLLTTVEQIDPIYVNFSQAATDLEQLRRAQANGQRAARRTEQGNRWT